jgi:hypothetical protein
MLAFESVLPILEPNYPLSTVLDARDAKATPRLTLLIAGAYPL